MIIPKSLTKLQQNFDTPLYIVGGYVRNSLLGISVDITDIDICGAFTVDEVMQLLDKEHYAVASINKRTGTVVIKDKDSGDKFEYTTFRTEVYAEGGSHTPINVEWTRDIVKDALRRDFSVNAIYYDIKNDKTDDPTGGLDDIKNKVIRCVDAPENVFCSDGLRIMRMARFACQLGFSIEESTLNVAKKYCGYIKDISSERIRDELDSILIADTKYPELDEKFAHYRGLCILSEIGAFAYILPELELGRGIEQRKDFHKFDVLEHSLQTVKYSDSDIRLSALLHDIAKATLYLKTGKMHGHDEEGQDITIKVLGQNGLKYPNKVVSEVSRLVRLHMLDLDCKMSEKKARVYIAENSDIFDKLMRLKQADYLGCGLHSGEAPTVIKWKSIYEKMKDEGIPFSLRQLKISALDIQSVYPDIEQRFYSQILKTLWISVVKGIEHNDNSKLLEQVPIITKNLNIQ